MTETTTLDDARTRVDALLADVNRTWDETARDLLFAEIDAIWTGLVTAGLVERRTLSVRELQVARLLAFSDLTGPQIASRLFVSIDTVKSHSSAAYRKLGVHSRFGVRPALLEAERLPGGEVA